MTNRPRLNTEGSLVAGLAAVGLFAVLAVVFIGVSFPAPTGFGENAAITKSLGAAMFDIAPGQLMDEGQTAVPGEGFLVAFLIIGVLLDAALDGAVMLAKREEEGENVGVGTDSTTSDDTALATDGGPETDDAGGAEP